MPSSSGGDRAEGSVTIQFVWAVGLTLVLLTVVANLVAFQYGRGVVRAALDEAVRAGSRATATEATCTERAAAALRDLLGGAMGDEVTVACADRGDRVVADATATFRGWLPLVPDWTFTAGATAVKERDPLTAP